MIAYKQCACLQRLLEYFLEFGCKVGTSKRSFRRMAESAVEALDCSGEGDLYEPLIGLRLGALFGILAVSSVGVILPLFTYTAKLNKAYFLVRAFAGGVVLVTGFVHVLGDAIPLLADPCLGLSTEFPWALVFTSFAAMFAFMLEWSLTQYFKRKLVPDLVDSKPEELESGLDSQVLDDKELERRRLRYVVISTTFEAGVIFHSIFIGITIGISSSADTVRSLMIALMFHQACEGLALGVTFVKAEYSVLKYCLLGLLFLVITPLGIAIGMGVGNSYQAQSKVALGFEGGFNSLSAGILIYNGLVDLIVPTFSPEELPVQSWLQGLGFICMFAGGAVMSLIAKWA